MFDERHKKGFTSKAIQRQLGVKRYEPVWAMAHKIRQAMGQRDDRYTLAGMIEADEGSSPLKLPLLSVANKRPAGAAGQNPM